MDETQLPQLACIPLTSVTPLYGLVSDREVIVISPDASITRASHEHLEVLSPEDVFLDHVRLYGPQHLLWKTIYVSPIEIDLMRDFVMEADKDRKRGFVDQNPDMFAYVDPVIQFLWAFQLFKPGRLVAGDTSFFARFEGVKCNTLALARCSGMSIDFQFVEQFAPHYIFNSEEVPFFLSFAERLGTAASKVLGYGQISTALHRYCKESAQYGDVTDLMTCLEALLVQEEEGIAFKLSQRVANLVGRDSQSRKELFKQIKDFYALRSKIVHGASIRRRDANAAQRLDDLREITRRVILSVIAYAADRGLDQGFYSMLNDLCFDEDLRESVHARSSALLHC